MGEGGGACGRVSECEGREGAREINRGGGEALDDFGGGGGGGHKI